MLAAFFAQLAVIDVPVLERIFRTVPLTVVKWGEGGLSALSVVVAVEIDKAVRRRRKLK